MIINTIIINVNCVTLDLKLKLVRTIINTWIWKHRKWQLGNLEKCTYDLHKLIVLEPFFLHSI